MSYFEALSPSSDGFCLVDQNAVQIQSSHHIPASKRGERAGRNKPSQGLFLKAVYTAYTDAALTRAQHEAIKASREDEESDL